uniref:Uncharacterized protein n=1 Tax=Bubo bubo TaxID=30461 RepID=A0A8C0IEV6_BUBBB
MEPNSPKKIQFAVPLFQSQIDPEAAEQVRKTSFFHSFEGMGQNKVSLPWVGLFNIYLLCLFCNWACTLIHILHMNTHYQQIK